MGKGLAESAEKCEFEQKVVILPGTNVNHANIFIIVYHSGSQTGGKKPVNYPQG